MFHNVTNRLKAVAVLTTIIAIALPTTGCTKKTHKLAPVSGKVIYKGTPLKFGVVMFQPEWGQPAIGRIQPDGTFQMTTEGEGAGAAIGRNKVRIACYEKPSAIQGEAGLGKLLIPEKYTSCDTSGIVVDVRADNNPPFLFELTDR